ncbi:MAG TPA: hypothetical protein VEA58_13905 [Anaerovoracaceae bacterium]|nr:hypothetical protein [Anaerovoracaceae bacterium]
MKKKQQQRYVIASAAVTSVYADIFMWAFLNLLTSRPIKFWIECVEVLGIQVILNDSERFTKSLEMNNFTFAEEFDRISNIRIVYETKDIIVSCSCFLFCCTFVKPTY